MANSLAVQGAIQFQAPSGTQFVNETVNLSVSTIPVGSGCAKQTYNATTSETSPTTPGITALGYVFFRNLDLINFVEIGAEAGQYCAKLQAGDISLIKWDVNTAIFVKSNVANVALQICAFSA